MAGPGMAQKNRDPLLRSVPQPGVRHRLRALAAVLDMAQMLVLASTLLARRALAALLDQLPPILRQALISQLAGLDLSDISAADITNRTAYQTALFQIRHA